MRLAPSFIVAFLFASITLQTGSVFSQDAKPASNEAVVALKNGDRVQGELTDDGKDEITVVSPVFGTVTLDRDQIDDITMLSASDEEAEAKKKAAASDV